MNISNFQDITEKGLFDLIEKMSKTYTNEWKMDKNNLDGGAVIAKLFSGMYSETLDRLGKTPYKNYLHLLNLLNVDKSGTTSAEGTVSFNVEGDMGVGVFLKSNTAVYADLVDEKGSDQRLVFETKRPITCISSKIINVFNVNPQMDIIEKFDFETETEEMEFFNPKESIQKHIFAIGHNDILNMKSKGIITIEMECFKNTNNKEDGVLEFLTDNQFSTWYYIDEEGKKYYFEDVKHEDKKIHLKKKEDMQIGLFNFSLDEIEENCFCIFCEVNFVKKMEILVSGVKISSAFMKNDKQSSANFDDFFFNDIALNKDFVGYCFGKSPTYYDSFYISSNEVFSKKNAKISIEMDLRTLLVNIGEEFQGPVYDFKNKYIVEKSNYERPRNDHTYITGVMWEYWNGIGWAKLEVKGIENPFVGEESVSRANITFNCPQNMSLSIQNSIENYWIRARVIDIENPYSLYGVRRLPFVEDIKIEYLYEDMKPSQKNYADNNCVKVIREKLNELEPMKLIEVMEEINKSVYIAFDTMPSGYPISLYFDSKGIIKPLKSIRYEYLCDVAGNNQWKELKSRDFTNNFGKSGILELHTPKNFVKQNIFNKEAYWIKISDISVANTNNLHTEYPLVKKIILNTVEIEQKQTVTETYTPKKDGLSTLVNLTNKKIIKLSLWVNEFGDLSTAEASQLLETNSEFGEEKVDSQNEFWVKWEEVSNLMGYKDERVYVLNKETGKIIFNDGKNGKRIKMGMGSVKVLYTFGGGAVGNLEENSIQGLIDSRQFIDEVVNFNPICGGNDSKSIEDLKLIGVNSLYNRNRAITRRDFEMICLENFNEVEDVKCFTGLDKNGQKQAGAVTLVVSTKTKFNRIYSEELCEKIFSLFKQKIHCELLNGEKFYVIPATIIEIFASVKLTIEDYDFAWQTERKIIEVINKVLEGKRNIGSLPTNSEFYGMLKKIDNVSYINEITLEGVYVKGNLTLSTVFDKNTDFPYGIPINSRKEHIVTFV